MLAEALLALASLAGNTVVVAATTDTWEAARHGFARLLGRSDRSGNSWRMGDWRRHTSSSQQRRPQIWSRSVWRWERSG
jgi:hypothetical protein